MNAAEYTVGPTPRQGLIEHSFLPVFHGVTGIHEHPTRAKKWGAETPHLAKT